MTDLRFRSNVVIIRDGQDAAADGSRARAAMPGDVASDTLSVPHLTARQRLERTLYQPCIGCGRSLWRIKRQGCEMTRCDGVVRAGRLAGPLEMLIHARAAVPDGSVAADPDAEANGRGRIAAIPEWQVGDSTLSGPSPA